MARGMNTCETEDWDYPVKSKIGKILSLIRFLIEELLCDLMNWKSVPAVEFLVY